jgi:hypothetical protein
VVLIFGFGNGKAQDRGETAPLICPQCHNQVFLHLVRSEKQFSLYFVPLVPYGSDEYLLCPVCQHGLQLRKDQLNMVQQMQGTTHAWRRGGYPGDYAAYVEWFWRQLGVNAPAPPIARGGTVAPPAPPRPAPARPPAAAPAPMAAPRAAAPVATAGSPTDVSGELQRLAKLHAAGGLSDEEFSAMKKRLLNL